jgi:hypothetical protein
LVSLLKLCIWIQSVKLQHYVSDQW